MRESRTYGSGRGACHETHVPTATCASWTSDCAGMIEWTIGFRVLRKDGDRSPCFFQVGTYTHRSMSMRTRIE